MSNESKHTPGPWEAPGLEQLNGHQIWTLVRQVRTDSVHNPVAFVLHNPVDDNGLAIREANAHLIAAAPDLLEALKVALNSLECIIYPYENGNDGGKGITEFQYNDIRLTIKEIEAAIAKALGTEQGEALSTNGGEK